MKSIQSDFTHSRKKHRYFVIARYIIVICIAIIFFGTVMYDPGVLVFGPIYLGIPSVILSIIFTVVGLIHMPHDLKRQLIANVIITVVFALFIVVWFILLVNSGL